VHLTPANAPAEAAAEAANAPGEAPNTPAEAVNAPGEAVKTPAPSAAGEAASAAGEVASTPAEAASAAGEAVSSSALAACPICQGHELVEFHGRPEGRCAGCGALERQRALARSHARMLSAGAGRSAVEFGPLNSTVFGGFLRERGWSYTGVDQSRRGHANDPRAVDFIDVEADLRGLTAFASDSVALVIAQHVIEEIPEFDVALSEIARILAKDGVALLEIPFDTARERSQRKQADHFGNVWLFGADLPELVRRSFASVELVGLAEGVYSGKLLVCRPSA
jgi:SAM-dependent methyltransferase